MYNLFDKGKQLKGFDRIFLKYDFPDSLMQVVILMVFKDNFCFRDFENLIGDYFVHFGNFSRRIVDAVGTAYWEEDPEFNLDNHFEYARLPEPALKPELEEYIGNVMATPLDVKRPRWKFHFIENYNQQKAIVACIHHAYADGVALRRILLSLIGKLEKHKAHKQLPGKNLPLSKALVQKAFSTVGNLTRGGKSVADIPFYSFKYLKKGLGLANSMLDMLTLPEDHHGRLKGKLGIEKCCVWSPTMKLSEAKEMTRLLNCTINHIALSCIAGALRKYSLEKGENVQEKTIRCIEAVDIRKKQDGRIKNRIGFFAIDLPTDLANPLERIYKIKNLISKPQDSAQLMLMGAAFAVSSMFPKNIRRQTQAFQSKKVSVLITNMTGFEKQISVAEIPMQEFAFWVPISFCSLAFSFTSYNNMLNLAINSDRKIINDPHTIISYFLQEMKTLQEICANLEKSGVSNE